VSTASNIGANAALRASHNYLGAFIQRSSPSGEEPKQKNETPTPVAKSDEATDPAYSLDETVEHAQLQVSDSSPTLALNTGASHDEHTPSPPNEDGHGVASTDVDDSGPVPQPGPGDASMQPQISISEAPETQHEPVLPRLDCPADDLDLDLDYSHRRSAADIRPLPPDDPSENPEQRANRIRSFYKEYFEETKLDSNVNHQSYYDGSEGYADHGYGRDQANHQAYEPTYDPVYDQVYDPAYDEVYDESHDPGYYYDQYPMEEDYSRSMTPPPRGPPRFMGRGHRPRSMSSGSYLPERSQVYSSASGRTASAMGGMRAKKKHLPPPKPLHVLPTPHLLKDDVILPIDYAPPSRSREQRAGTPDGLRGGLRPYSPAVPAHLPLASSFDDLASMPSP
jgi:hypothetical protein